MSRLISEWTVGPPTPKWCGWGPFPTSDQGTIGFASTGNRLAIWRLNSTGAGKEYEFCVPEGAEFVAVHSATRRLAVIQSGLVSILDPSGSTLKSRQLSGADDSRQAILGTPENFRYAAWGPNGRILWLGLQDDEGENRICALSGDTLETIGISRILGEEESGHVIQPHPDGTTAVVEVSCGQDGTWISAVRSTSSGLQLLKEKFESINDPICLSAFNTDGKCIAGVSSTEVKLFSWPGLELLISQEVEDVGGLEHAAYLGESEIVVAADAEPEWELLHLSKRDLKIQKRVELGFSTDQIHSVCPLSASLVLAWKGVQIRSFFGRSKGQATEYKLFQV